MSIQIILSHGLEGNAYGRKLRWLAAVAAIRGPQVQSVAYNTFDGESDQAQTMANPLERLTLLVSHVRALRERSPDDQLMLVGSSMGGWVSCAVSESYPVDGLLLLAPAVGLSKYPFEPKPKSKRITVVHGFDDVIVPFQNAVDFASQHKAKLLGLPDGHRLQGNLVALAHEMHHLIDEIEAENPKASAGLLTKVELVQRLTDVLYWMDPMNTACMPNHATDEYTDEAAHAVDRHLESGSSLAENLIDVVNQYFGPMDLAFTRARLKDVLNIIEMARCKSVIDCIEREA